MHCTFQIQDQFHLHNPVHLATVLFLPHQVPNKLVSDIFCLKKAFFFDSNNYNNLFSYFGLFPVLSLIHIKRTIMQSSGYQQSHGSMFLHRMISSY